MYRAKIKRIPIPLLYTPIDANNPVLSLLDNTDIEIGITIGREGFRLRDNGVGDSAGLGETLEKLLQLIHRELGGPNIGVEVALSHPYSLGLFVAIEVELLRTLGLSKQELVDLAIAINDKLGLSNTVSNALIHTYYRGVPLVYRNGEEAIELDGLFNDCRIVYGGRRLRLAKPTSLLNIEAIRASVIHLGGYNVIHTARCLLSRGLRKCREILYDGLRMLNGLYYIVYGIKPPERGFYILELDRGVLKADIMLP